MYGSTSCKIQYIHPLSEAGRAYAAVPGAGVVLLEGAVPVVAETVRREAVTVVRPNDPGHNRVEYTLESRGFFFPSRLVDLLIM